MSSASLTLGFPSAARLMNRSSFRQTFKAPLVSHCRPLNVRPNGSSQFCFTRCPMTRAFNVTAGQPDGSGDLGLGGALDLARKLWSNVPQPVKDFPWNVSMMNFIRILIDLICAVVKYLCVPLLGISSLSEMSYCAHERKMVLVPFPFILGIAVTKILKDTTIELYPHLEAGEIPWHLLVVASFFTLVKLPGPDYPYWGRLLLPHFANGGLWTTLWYAFMWYRRPRKEMEKSHVEDKN
ncbi:hypothetical protein QJS10_CPB11g00617 [Acorus calamus]|uniref:Uncharacterized protein n=1 Tax=Acorus calamus TaxID=4465 RepID=A0AAV9DQ67_ACOCL|nr:hypothetical protein QJS10_CPB11g00617 [Acorus calamus]